MTDDTPAGFTGHLYGIGRNKTSKELADEIRSDLDFARQVGKLPAEVTCRVGAVTRLTHSNTFLIVAEGPVHAAEYAAILAIANAYNKIEPGADGDQLYQLEVYAPDSPEVRLHPAMALVEKLGEYEQAWRDRLGDGYGEIKTVQRALELAATAEALGAGPRAEVDGTLPPVIATYAVDGVIRSMQTDGGHVFNYGIDMPFTVPGTSGPVPGSPYDWTQTVLSRYRADRGRRVRLTLEVLGSYETEDGQDATGE